MCRINARFLVLCMCSSFHVSLQSPAIYQLSHLHFAYPEIPKTLFAKGYGRTLTFWEVLSDREDLVKALQHSSHSVATCGSSIKRNNPQTRVYYSKDVLYDGMAGTTLAKAISAESTTNTGQMCRCAIGLKGNNSNRRHIVYNRRGIHNQVAALRKKNCNYTVWMFLRNTTSVHIIALTGAIRSVTK